MKNYIIMLILICLMYSFCLAQESVRTSVLITKDIMTIKAEGNAFLGSGLNPDDAKTFALNDAKRNALNQAGTYIESHTEVVNYVLTKDEITSITGSFIQIKELSTTKEIIQGDFAIRVLIEATIDLKLLDRTIEKIRNDVSLKQQLEALLKRNDKLEKQITALQKKGATFTKEEVKEAINKLSASEWLQKGLEAHHLAQGNPDLKLAIQYYKNAIKIDPNYVDAYNNIAGAYSELGDYSKAFEYYTEAINRAEQMGTQKDKSYLYTNRANCSFRQEKYREALKDLNIAIQIDPDKIYAYGLKGGINLILKNYQKTIENYNEAILLSKKVGKIDEQLGEYFFNRGLAKHYIKEDISSLADMIRACEVKYASACERLEENKDILFDKDFSEILNALGSRALQQLSLMGVKTKIYQAAINILEDNIEIYEYFLDNKNLLKYELTMTVWDAPLTLSLVIDHDLLQLGQTYVGLAFSISKDGVHPAYDAKRIDEAIAYFEDGKKAFERATKLLNSSEFSKYPDFTKWLNFDRETYKITIQSLVACYVEKGNILDGEGKLDQALQYYDKAIDLNSNDPNIFYNKGIAYYNNGQYKNAIPNFTKAIELKKDFALAYLHRGKSFANSWTNDDEREKAIQDLKKAIQLNNKLGTEEIKDWIKKNEK